MNSGYLRHCILDPKILAKYLEAVEDDLEETAPEFELVFTSVYQCHDLKEDLMGTKFFIIFVKYT